MKPVVVLKSHLAYPGGLEKYTRHLAQAFAQKGCPTTILTTGDPPQVEGVRVLSLGATTKFSLLHLLRFDQKCRDYLHKHPHEIIFGMERHSWQTHVRLGGGLHSSFLQRRSLVEPKWKSWSFAINPLHQKLLAMEKKLFRDEKVKKVFVNSSMVKKEILTKYPGAAARLELVPNGVEWHAMEPAFQKRHAPKSPYHFLFVGNGFERKGLSWVLEGLKQVEKEDFFLTVVGKDKNLQLWKERAKPLGQRIEFAGPVHHLLPYYQRADALLIPSLYDPCANVTLEALAMGLFVISSPTNGASEWITPYSGIVIDPPSLGLAITQALKRGQSLKEMQKIRDSISHLDFSHQLAKLVQSTL